MKTDYRNFKPNASVPAILIYGEEDYDVDRAARSEIELLNSDYRDFNYDKCTDVPEIGRVKEILETFPLFDQKRILFIEDIDLSRNKIKQIDFLLEPLAEYLPEIPSGSVLLMTMKGKAFRGKFVKSVEKHGIVVECKKYDYRELRKFILSFFDQRNKKYEADAIGEIIEQSHYLDGNLKKSLYDVKGELEKLAGHEGTITKNTVQDIMTSSYETNIFKLMDRISVRNGPGAMETYRSLILGGGDPFQIFYMILRQIRNIIFIKEQKRRHIVPGKGRKALKMSKFEYNKILKNVNFWRYKQLYKALHKAFETEVKLKSINTDPEILIELFLFEILM